MGTSPQEVKAHRQLAETIEDEPRMLQKAERLVRWTKAISWTLLCGLFLAAFGAREEGLWLALFTILGCVAGVLAAIASYSTQGIVQWRVIRPFLDVEAIKRANKERKP